MLAVIPAAVLLCFLYLVRRKQQRIPLPPGPKGLFLLGNVLDIPKSHEWVTYAEWAKVYDRDLFRLNLAGQNVVILNSFAAAEELLEGRSAVFSSRPRLPMVNELVGWDYSFGLMKYGEWRQSRKFMHQSFRPSSVTKFQPHIMKAVHRFVRNLLAQPEEYTSHIRYMSADVILSITYGLEIQPERDPYVELVEKALESLNEATIPGRFIVDLVPWLKYVPDWMPFAGFKRQAKEWRKYALGVRDIPYKAVRDNIIAGKGVESLVLEGLRTIGEDENSDDWEVVVKSVAGTMYTAAGDTTTATITNGILALMCHPDVLKKAQAEIDAVVQPGNLPEFRDKDSLPYLSAFIKELLRWSSVVPLGVPHVNESGDIYKGYHIPANSVVTPNLWAMMHDEEVYPDPFTFNPDRFMKNGKLNEGIRDPERIAFGFGRRICPGRHFSSLSTWMTMACLITLFDFSKPVDENGDVIEPKLEWSSSVVSFPAPFKCKIVPRSREASSGILRTEGYEYFTE
ncbi:hypothetical protein AX16_004465 [Volvariella volvacea WC 439]|nr:hypothetical protein AX16_004465 [Volvariella volvacea WC 439]